MKWIDSKGGVIEPALELNLEIDKCQPVTLCVASLVRGLAA